MRILVTGGAGFIGTNFIRFLASSTSHEVVNLDLLTYAGRRQNLAEVERGRRYRFVHGDIADPELVDRVMAEGIDAVVNLAAESHVDRSLQDARAFLRTNVVGTQTLLDAARRHSVERFVQVSTDEVYGDLGVGEPAFTEGSHLKPSSPYSASKAAADLLTLAAWRTWGLPVVVTRCSNNYGPFQHSEKFIPTLIIRALNGDSIPIYGNGLNVRDWIHVSDHCRGILLALERGRDGEVYNIGGNNEMFNIEVARTILRLLDRSEGLIRFVRDRPGHDRRYAINFGKASSELRYEPKIGFGQGIVDTLSWYAINMKSIE